MFLTISKRIKAKKFVKKQVARQKELKVDEINKISSVACIVNIDEFENVQELLSFAEALRIDPDQFTIITYTKTPEKYKHIKYPKYTFKDFNWRLKPKGTHIKLFLSKEYDLLINYFTKKQLPLLFLSLLTQAGIRVGFKKLDTHYNDIIFKVDTRNSTLFKSELLKYLNVLNKI